MLFPARLAGMEHYMDDPRAPRSSSPAFDAYCGSGLMLLGTMFTCPAFTCTSPLMADALCFSFEAAGLYLIATAAIAVVRERSRPSSAWGAALSR